MELRETRTQLNRLKDEDEINCDACMIESYKIMNKDEKLQEIKNFKYN